MGISAGLVFLDCRTRSVLGWRRRTEDTKGCIISEIDLPGINGLALLNRLKDREIELPVIFITGHENLSTAVEACRMRVADYLMKPFIPKALVGRLRNILDEHSARNN